MAKVIALQRRTREYWVHERLHGMLSHPKVGDEVAVMVAFLASHEPRDPQWFGSPSGGTAPFGREKRAAPQFSAYAAVCDAIPAQDGKVCSGTNETPI